MKRGSRDTRVLVESASSERRIAHPEAEETGAHTFPPWEEDGSPSPGVRWLLDEVQHLMNYG